MNSGRILMFNGKILADSSSVTMTYKGENGDSHRYFSSVDDLCDEMKKIAGATTSMGKGKIRDVGEILDPEDLFSVMDSVKENELVLVKTRYEVIGDMAQYQEFLEHIRKLPGLVMVGVWTDDLSKFRPDGVPILLW